jgi:hypothetical protein
VSALLDPRVGLCAACRNVRVVESKRGSRFYLCQLSDVDPRFAKYPRLPVVRCLGFVAVADVDSDRDAS